MPSRGLTIFSGRNIGSTHIAQMDKTSFGNKKSGGFAVIVSDTGERRVAVSTVSFEVHVNTFKDGKRN